MKNRLVPKLSRVTEAAKVKAEKAPKPPGTPKTKHAVADQIVQAPKSKDLYNPKLSQTLVATTGKNPHIQQYYVDTNKDIDKARQERNEAEETSKSRYERAFNKPFKDFSDGELKSYEADVSRSMANKGIPSDKAEYVVSGITAAAQASNPLKGFDKTLTVRNEGKGVTIISPLSRKRGEKLVKNEDLKDSKKYDNVEDPDAGSEDAEDDEVDTVTPEDLGKTKVINVYKHTDSDGKSYEETLFEHHKRIKDGGATEEDVKNYAMILMRLGETSGAIKPDAFVIPPVTGVDGKGNQFSDEEINDKVSRSINHRVAQFMSDHLTYATDKETGAHVSKGEHVTRVRKGLDDTVNIERPSYDPMSMGLKDFQAKKIAGRVRDAEGNLKMQQDAKVRGAETLKRFRKLLGIGKDLDPKEREAALQGLKDKYKGVKHVWLIDDNVDKGGTLFAMSKIFEEIGITSTAMSLFDMSGARKHPERESAKALDVKSQQGKLQFAQRKEKQNSVAA